MGLFRRKKPETRAITASDVPWVEGGPLHREVNQDRALRLAPVYAANRHLGDLVSTLPLQAYRRLDEQTRNRIPLPTLLRTMEEEGTLPGWLFTAVSSLGLRGNAVGLVSSWDRYGYPQVVTWLPMSEVFVDDTAYPRATWWWKGRPLDRSELVHIPWFTIPGRTLGLSPIEAYALSIGLAAQEFGNDWFTNGGIPPGTFKNSEKLVDNTEAEIIRQRLVSSIRQHKPLVYGADWDYNPITIPPDDAQFIETLKLTANQIAAIYGIAPEEVGGEAANSLTYSNEEMRQTRRIADARPWLVRLESAFTALLPPRMYVRFNADAVVRADAKSRWEIHRLAREIGARNIDEIRALEDEAPLPDGKGTDYTPLVRRTVGESRQQPEWAPPT